MYIVNTTFIVESTAQDARLNIIKNMYIPFVNSNGFNDITFTRVISIEPTREFTYSIQVGISDMEQYNIFMERVLIEYSTITTPIFGEKIVWFTSLMKKL